MDLCLTRLATGSRFKSIWRRDYIHVVDLAEGHVKALDALHGQYGVSIWNLGTGLGYSVLEVVRAFEKVSGVVVPLVFEGRRAGDIARCWADPEKALSELGWSTRRSLERMLADAWRWECHLHEDEAVPLVS